MGSFYRLWIDCGEKMKERVDQVLGQATDDPALGWSLSIEENSPKFLHALDFFIDLISNNLDRLSEIDVLPGMISFWYNYEYEEQCNMAFEPHITKSIGDLGVALCISCWEKQFAR